MYELAPEGVKVKTLPTQTEPLLMLTVGRVTTVTVAVAVFAETQPSVLVPLTV